MTWLHALAQVSDCSQYEDLSDIWIKPTQWVDGVVCPYSQVIGETFAFGLVLIGINVALYARQDRLIMPVVVTLVTGGAWISLAPGAVAGAVQAGVLVMLGIGPVLLIRRLDRT